MAKPRATHGERYWVVDRKPRGSLQKFSAANPRYLVWDEQEQTYVGQFVSAKAARDTARDLNRGARNG